LNNNTTQQKMKKAAGNFRAALSGLLSGLLPQTEAGNQGAVSIDILTLKVIEQLATLANHAQQTTTGVVILLVLFEVRGQIVDACGQQRDLNFGEPVSPLARWKSATTAALLRW
jgi:hypothetical protein